MRGKPGTEPGRARRNRASGSPGSVPPHRAHSTSTVWPSRCDQRCSHDQNAHRDRSGSEADVKDATLARKRTATGQIDPESDEERSEE